MAGIAVNFRPPALDWLRGPRFDISLILGLTALALMAGALVAVQPLCVPFILLADNWLLGYPHVISTFTRIAPDRAGVQSHRFTVLVLPVLVVAATAAMAVVIGTTLVVTIYFYWQWYHTARQSWGIAQLYRRKSSTPVREDPRLAEATFMLIPLWGLLHRLTQPQDHFLYPGLTIAVPMVPAMLADAVGIAAGAALLYWAYCRLREWLRGELPVAHTVFSASHYVIFIVGYVLVQDVTGGWVVTNIWHTAQYLMLVWLFNEKGASAAQGWFRSVSRGNRPLYYFGFCFLAAFFLYALIAKSFAWGVSGVVLAIIASQSLNFHHFITDSLIWRSGRKPTPAAA